VWLIDLNPKWKICKYAINYKGGNETSSGGVTAVGSGSSVSSASSDDDKTTKNTGTTDSTPARQGIRRPLDFVPWRVFAGLNLGQGRFEINDM